jgi:hypothetical protein
VMGAPDAATAACAGAAGGNARNPKSMETTIRLLANTKNSLLLKMCFIFFPLPSGNGKNNLLLSYQISGRSSSTSG